MIFELATLSCPVLGVPAALPGVRDWISNAGTVFGLWRTEIGRIGDLTVLRGFETRTALSAERERALRSDDPFGSRTAGARLSTESYRAFPFLPPIRPRAPGGLYEFRCYHLTAGGLPGTLQGWEAALEPARAYADHLVVNLFAEDGPSRIVHLWQFDTLEQRNALRRAHYADGRWPPKGGPERIEAAFSSIALAEPGFPLG